MIRSMTGYGKSAAEIPGRDLTLEIRSLNSKQLDLAVKLPAFLREKELEIRSLVSQQVIRGKADVFCTVVTKGETVSWSLNRELARRYHEELKELQKELREDCPTGLLPIVVKMPDVIVSGQEEVAEADWEVIREALMKACAGLDEFRVREGKVLEADFRMRIDTILTLLEAVAPFEANRIETVRRNLLKGFASLEKTNGIAGQIDPNRFEQELIFYLEKLDFTEEKVRLKKHCEHFLETLEQEEAQGRKLGFITQEIGREINTLGSKAADADIQRIVVRMKDELEKIKEQLLNIL